MAPPTRRRYGPALAVAAVLLVTSLVPVPATGGGSSPTILGLAIDKWAHLVGYATLAALLARGRPARSLFAVTAVVLVTVGFGGGVELLQGLVPTRNPSVADAAANAVGAAGAGAVWLAAVRWRPAGRGRT